MKAALIGSTGLVGQEFKRILLSDSKPLGVDVYDYASRARPEEKVAAFEELLKNMGQYKYFINAADADQARAIAQNLTAGQYLIDNSSAFRMAQDVPLVVPEINATSLTKDTKIIANPNCTAALLCMTLAPLKQWGIKRVVVSTYQAASGAGIKGLNELTSQIESWSKNPAVPLKSEVFPHPLFLNVMSHNTAIRFKGEGQGYNDEEWKVITETRKILGLLDLSISATCIRVPVLRAHTEAVTVDLDKSFELAEVKTALAQFPGVYWQHDEEKNRFPMPLDSQNKDDVFVGRLRQDPFLKNTLHFVLSGDQLRKGAALNAYQILKALIKRA